MWRDGTAKDRKDAAAEYRLQRVDLGLSPYSRRRLEWTIESADEAKERGQQRRTRHSPSPITGDDPRNALSAAKGCVCPHRSPAGRGALHATRSADRCAHRGVLHTLRKREARENGLHNGENQA